ncbi:HAMP domain-containing protein [Shewanella eurypsychrophilus]|uniref:histidine kinase n=1 Tax=Shewanella eurypsychrophilus TaxID=2593656 RepID=A0ABX6V6T8_9GAMM|nr:MULTISPECIES: ATP-binding protein [Shewanella]QFU20679.1 HAMP domain-containing protein [Shewanella sp. YLB-09]QFU20959.1 HAMP domain-containing protein [Shewanella sp. YLB-09]QPG56247.1 HAMP domain-containing protein [Shewanella eurypsychrophilus]
MTVSKLPNRIFIKLLLGFWFCSSLIIAIVGLLPLLQQNHDRAPLPPHLERMLTRVANNISERLISDPQTINTSRLKRLTHLRDRNDKPVRFYIVDHQGRVINSHKVSRGLRRFMLMSDEVDRPMTHQFKSELIFGPYKFNAAGEQYSIYGRLADHHPRPWFFFFAENKLLTLGLAIILSGLLCGLLAWHLGKPLRTLKLTADSLAAGDLANRVDKSTTKRKDEIGQLALAFNSMADSVENMVHSQQRLISDISHELRTPLTRLQLALALARKKGQDTAETQRIGYEAEQLEQMIAELLELSRVKLNIHDTKHLVSLNETLSQVLDDADFEAAQQGKVLVIDIDDAISLPTNPRPLARAIENLLRNAIRYAEQQISITAQSSEKEVTITIADDGPGIENEQDLKAVFDPFYRPQTARERESGGWGLGLAITKAAIDAHQGEIVADNLTPHGLRVTIKLPS